MCVYIYVYIYIYIYIYIHIHIPITIMYMYIYIYIYIYIVSWGLGGLGGRAAAAERPPLRRGRVVDGHLLCLLWTLLMYIYVIISNSIIVNIFITIIMMIIINPLREGGAREPRGDLQEDLRQGAGHGT